MVLASSCPAQAATVATAATKATAAASAAAAAAAAVAGAPPAATATTVTIAATPTTTADRLTDEQPVGRRAGGMVGARPQQGHIFYVTIRYTYLHTNNRAELAAVFGALGLELRPMEVRTDSSYVLNGVLRWRARWRANGWTRRGREIANADLWKQMDQILQEAPDGHLQFTKAKGHATEADVKSGMVSAFDRQGNDAADRLAVAGACAAHVHPRDRHKAQERILLAMEVQGMMLKIAQARARRLPLAVEASDDESASSSSSSAGSGSTSASSGTGATEMPPDGSVGCTATSSTGGAADKEVIFILRLIHHSRHYD